VVPTEQVVSLDIGPSQQADIGPGQQAEDGNVR